MLQNWLKPVPATLAKAADALPETACGRNLVIYRDTFPDLKKVQIALLGIGDKEANDIREQFYRNAYSFPRGMVADLGNLRKLEPSQVMPVIYELLSGKILPVLLAGKAGFARAQFLAYQDTKALLNLAVVDERLGLSAADAYGSLLQPRHPLLFHFALLGHQTHQMAPETLRFLAQNNFDLVRLGRSRTAIEETEPVLRDADLLAFHLGALRQSEAPGVAGASPSGLFVEEACQLCRYAGLSDKLTSFGIYGYQRDTDRDGQTAQVVSQMLWYFMEAFFNRKGDYPVSKNGLTEYIVDFRQLNYQLTFWKSVKSGRWWMQVPVPIRKKHERHRLVPCSYQDYQAACREELPERLMQAMSRFG